MALYLSSDLSKEGYSGGGGGGDISTIIRTTTSWYFHALRRDESGMLYYTVLRPSDADSVDVFNEENSQLTDLLDGIDNVESSAPVKVVSFIAGGTTLASEANASYSLLGLRGNNKGQNLDLTITRDSNGSINDLTVEDGGRDFLVGEEVIIPASLIGEVNSQANLYLRVTEVVKTYSNSASDKYQQYRFDLRKISYYIDDQGYLVAKFGNHDYSQGPR